MYIENLHFHKDRPLVICTIFHVVYTLYIIYNFNRAKREENVQPNSEKQYQGASKFCLSDRTSHQDHPPPFFNMDTIFHVLRTLYIYSDILYTTSRAQREESLNCFGASFGTTSGAFRAHVIVQYENRHFDQDLPPGVCVDKIPILAARKVCPLSTQPSTFKYFL